MQCCTRGQIISENRILLSFQLYKIIIAYGQIVFNQNRGELVVIEKAK